MLHLLDANVLIDANRDYYPIGMVPEFWDWLLYQAEIASAQVPLEIYEEVADSPDELGQWLRRHEVKQFLVLPEEPDLALVSRAVSEGYAPDLREDEVMRLGRDPFLVAYGLVDSGGRCIVTTEGSKPSRVRANRHLPDVCGTFGLDTCHTFELTRRLGFTTQWRRPEKLPFGWGIAARSLGRSRFGSFTHERRRGPFRPLPHDKCLGGTFTPACHEISPGLIGDEPSPLA
jgi:hypothetical protein